MATRTCPQCHRAMTAPASSGALPTCSHCQSPVDSAAEKASRWFIVHQNEKRGPYSWRTLLAMVSRGDLDPDAMHIKEHSARWVRAHSLHACFTSVPAARTTTAAGATAVDTTLTPLAPPVQEPVAFAAPTGVRRSIWNAPWVMEGLAAASISVLLGLSVVLGYYALNGMSLFGSRPATAEQHVASPVPDTSR